VFNGWSCTLEGVGGSGYIDPRILVVGASRRWVVIFTLLQLYSWWKASATHFIGSWVGPRTGLDNVKNRKIFPLPGLEIRPLGHSVNLCINFLILECKAENWFWDFMYGSLISLRVWSEGQNVIGQMECCLDAKVIVARANRTQHKHRAELPHAEQFVHDFHVFSCIQLS
jgi:hypothetical protein